MRPFPPLWPLVVSGAFVAVACGQDLNLGADTFDQRGTDCSPGCVPTRDPNGSTSPEPHGCAGCPDDGSDTDGGSVLASSDSGTDAGAGGSDTDGGSILTSSDSGTNAGADVTENRPYAPWLGEGHVATGTCKHTRIEPYSCYPGTPGRDANGCCVATTYGSDEEVSVTFGIEASTDGADTLTLHECTAVSPVNNGVPWACAWTAPPIPSGPDGVFESSLVTSSVALKTNQLYLPYRGPLRAKVEAWSTNFAITFNGEANDTAGRCGDNRWLKSCTLLAQP
jgi:hypothetical protein